MDNDFKATITQKINNEQYPEVIEELNEVLKSKKFTSAWLESTLAKAHQNQGELAQAHIHILNSVFIDRTNSTLRNNLEYTQAQIESQLGTPMQHPADWGFRLASWIRPLESAGISFLFLNSFLLLRFFLKRSTKRDTTLGFCTVLFMLISLFGYFGTGISVVKSPTQLLESPISSSKELRTIPGGARVRAIKESGKYTEIERADSFRGWVKSSNLHFFY